MATALDTFFPLVRGRITGCPFALIREALIWSADEFCRRTRLLTEESPIDVIAGERFADLFPPDGEVFVVEQVRRDNWRLEELSRHDFEVHRFDTSSGSPRAYYVEGDRRLVLGPIPDADETLIGRFVLRPALSARTLNDRLYVDWRDGIAAGARAYLRRHSSTWADPQEELTDRTFFEDAISRANMDRAQGGTRRPLRAKGYFF